MEKNIYIKPTLEKKIFACDLENSNAMLCFYFLNKIIECYKKLFY